MKVQQIFNFVRQKMSSVQTQSSQDLTSFGSQSQTNTDNDQLISKDAAEAIKNKYMSNLSFKGYQRSVEVKGNGHYETKEHRIYGTGGANDYKIEAYSNYVLDNYEARIAGSRKSSSSYNIDSAVRSAIIESGDYRSGSRIEKKHSIYMPNNSESYKYGHNAVGSVYFSDPGEKVKSSKRSGCNYVVYAPGARDADERSAWEKFWD